MSQDRDLDPIVAVGLGANKGFWMRQLRDKLGQWMEMGLEALMMARIAHGLPPFPIRAKYVGPSQRVPGLGRFLIKGRKGRPDRIYELDPAKMQMIQAEIPEEVLKRQGIKPGLPVDSAGNPVQPKDFDENDIINLSEAFSEEPTEEDYRLAEAVPTPEERKILEEERAKSPLAQLPPGTEGKMSEQEVADLLEGKTQAPAAEAEPEKAEPEAEPAKEAEPEVEPEKVEPEAESGIGGTFDTTGMDPKAIGKMNAAIGKPIRINGEVTTLRDFLENKSYGVTAYDVVKYDDNANPIVTGQKFGVYTDSDLRTFIEIPKMAFDAFKPNSGVVEDRRRSSKEAEPSQVEDAVEKAIKDAMDGKLVSVDDVIDNAKPSGKRKGAPQQPEDEDITWDDEGEVTPTPEEEKEPVPGEEFVEEEGDVTPVNPKTEQDVPLDIPESERTGDPETADKVSPAKPDPSLSAEALLEAFETVGKMSDEELDKIAAANDFTQDMGGFTPSVEQARALAAIAVANVDTVMEALAGAGKTSVVVGAARTIARLRPNDGVLVLCFGTKNAADAKVRLPRENADAMTTHKLARKTALSKTQRSALKGGKAAIINSDKDLALFLETDDTPGPDKQPIDAEAAAMLVRKIITEYCNSNATKLSSDHVLSGFSKFFGMPKEDFGDGPGLYKIDPKWLKWAEKFWGNIESDIKPGYYDKVKKKFVGEKRIKIDHDHYLKLWQLGNPDLSKLTVKGKPVKVILMDEAQDTNPTVATVLKGNKGRLQISYVGDTNQNIFGFRGSENALREAKATADAVIPLTMTYRFGDALTGPANGFLNILGHNTRMIGTDSEGAIVEDEDDLEFGPSRAHLTRSNWQGMKDIIEFMVEGKKVGALSVFYNELRSNYYYVQWLQREFSDPERKKGPRFPDGSPIQDCDFSRLKNMGDWARAAKRDPKSIVARWKKGYDMGEFENIGKIIDNIIVDRSDVGDVDSTLDATKGSSGRMWIAADGKPLDYEVFDNGTMVFNNDGTLAYVNGEKFGQILKDRGYSWNDEERGRSSFTGWAKLFYDDDERQKELDELAALIPNRLNINEEVPDVIVSTAHRAKGLEWDDVSIGEDWATPEGDQSESKEDPLGADALRLAYVAASRARKRLYLGTLDWVRQFEGREGLTLANEILDRPKDFGMDAWDYREERKAEMAEVNPTKKKKIGAALSSSDRKGRIKDEGPVTVLRQGPSDGGNVPPNFLDGWVRVGAGDRKQYSKKIEGVRWEITLNSDGSVLLRNRSDSSVPSKKYSNLSSLEADFKKTRNDGVKNNRENAKKAINDLGIDPTGKLAKMIDNGASGDEVFDEIIKTQAMLDAIEDNDVSLSTLMAALDKLNNGRSLSANDSKKLRKPRNPQPRKPGKVTLLPPGSSASLFNSNPTRQDDGKDVGRAGITPAKRDQFIRAGGTETVSQMIDALLQLNPDAKVRPDGSIVWYRVSNYEEPETSKDFAGDKVDFELRIVPSQSGTLRVVAALRDSNAPKKLVETPNGQFVEDDEYTQLFNHYSPHKSLDSVLGVVDNPLAKTKSAGVERLLDMFFDRNFGKIPAPGKSLKQRQQYIRYYGGIQGSLKRLRTGKLSSILNDKAFDDTKFVFRTPEEEAIIILNGRDQRHNLSTSRNGENFRRVMRKEMPSLYDALDQKDSLAAFQALLGYVESIPDTNAAKEVARSVVKRSVQEKFPYLDKNELEHLLARIDHSINRQVLPAAGTKVIPHRYVSGEISQVGDVVRWGNNQKEYCYGRVVQKLQAERDDSGNYGYGNYVYVSFPGIDNPIKLSTFHLTKASPDQEPTSGRRTVKLGQRVVERSLSEGDSVNFDTGEIISGKTGEPIPNIGFDPDFIDFGAIDFTKYAEQIIGGPKATKETPITDVNPGDTLWDPNGGRMGTIKGVRTGTAKNGNRVVQVTFSDGSKVTFPATDKVLSSSPPGPKQAEPLTPLGETARDLGLGIDPTTGAASRTLAIHKTADLNDDNTSPVKDSQFRAVKPTDEAREAKNDIVGVGSDIRARVDDKLIDILRNREKLNVSSAADVDTIFKEVADVSRKASDATKQAKKDVRAIHDSGVKVFSTAASRKTTMAKLAADGFVLPNGVVDRDKLAKELAGKRLGSLAALVEEATDKNESLFAYAYTALNDPATNAKVKTAQKALEAAKRASTDAAKKHMNMGAVVGKAARDAYREVMAEEGVELDNVSVDEFDGHLYSLKRKLKLRSVDTFKSKEALEEFFDGLPSSVIRGLLAQLKAEDKKLYIMSGVKRAYMTDEPDGYAVHLSNKRSKQYDDVTSATDAAVHEVQHVLEHIMPNIGALQHAWLYDRAVMFPGTEDETLPNFAFLPGQGMGRGERALAVPGLSLGYMSKQYPEDKKHILNPNDGHFEVSTVLMQELLSSFGIASRGKGLNVVTTDFELDGTRKVISDVHFDPKSGRYYTDDTLQTPIDNAIMAFGRDPKTGIDNDARDFAYGMVFSLANRTQPPGGGSGSGNNPPPGGGAAAQAADVSVPKPSAAVQSILQKESSKPDAGFLATILSKFGGGTNLTREEYAELLDYLTEEFGSGSGYAASQVRAVKNYLAKILGL